MPDSKCVFCVRPAVANVAVENPRDVVIAYWPMCLRHVQDGDAVKSAVYYSAELSLN